MCSILGKTLEHIAKDQLLEHITKISPLNRRQHGFCVERLTVTNLLDFDKFIGAWENQSLPYDIVTIDFCRAFDKAPHALILDSLASKKLHQKTLGWFNSFFTMHRQRVRINGYLSEPADVTSGEVQGSAVGPLIFAIHIDPLLESTNCQCVAFADDAKFANTPDTPSQASIQLDLYRIGAWSTRSFLPLAVEKCFIVHGGRYNPNCQYHCNGYQLSVLIQFQDLGVVRSFDAGYSSHSGSIVTKGNRAVGTIFRGLCTREAPVLWNAFQSYVVPLLEYALQCWNPKLKKNIKSIESIQKRFTKHLTGMSQFNYNEHLVALSATTLETRRNVADLTFAFKCLHGLVDVKPEEIGLELQHGITRGAGVHLHQPKAVNCRVGSMFMFRIPALWNSLLASILQYSSASCFKNRLLIHFKNSDK